MLRHVHGYSVEEISELSGAPPYTVRDRLKTGRSKLRKRLSTSRAILDWLGSA